MLALSSSVVVVVVLVVVVVVVVLVLSLSLFRPISSPIPLICNLKAATNLASRGEAITLTSAAWLQLKVTTIKELGHQSSKDSRTWKLEAPKSERKSIHFFPQSNL